MAKLAKWSASKLKGYQDCPYKFYCNYIAGMYPEGNAKALTWGSGFHQTAEWFYADFAFPSKAELLKYYEDNWIAEQYVKDWNKQKAANSNLTTWEFLGYDSAEEELQYFRVGQKIVSDFWDNHFPNKYLPFAVELKFEEQLPTGELFIGFIDRVDYPGAYRIVDYKTGKWESSSEELKKDLQLGLYHWAFCKKYGIPYSSVEYCALYYVRSSNLVPVRFIGAEIDGLLEQVNGIITKVDSNYFPKNPRKPFICKFCPYKGNNPCDAAQM